jgi:hypothetical protein
VTYLQASEMSLKPDYIPVFRITILASVEIVHDLQQQKTQKAQKHVHICTSNLVP